MQDMQKKGIETSSKIAPNDPRARKYSTGGPNRQLLCRSFVGQHTPLHRPVELIKWIGMWVSEAQGKEEGAARCARRIWSALEREKIIFHRRWMRRRRLWLDWMFRTGQQVDFRPLLLVRWKSAGVVTVAAARLWSSSAEGETGERSLKINLHK